MLSAFHPLVAQWFRDSIGEPTDAQCRGWAAIRERQHTLIAAPTGSGKTLAAFLTALDDLFQEGLRGPLPDQVRVVYVSPLKALSADIHKNLAEPRRGIRALAERAGLPAPRITAAVRTGDTTQTERASMLRTPPHVLVTTPESLYLLLTADRSRAMLRTAHTVIVDEIHAVIGTRRGAHLALTLERLDQVVGAPLVRIGLSATQNPIGEVARFLVGTGPTRRCAKTDSVLGDPPSKCDPALTTEDAEDRRNDPGGSSLDSEAGLGPAFDEAGPHVHVVDQGHRRHMDLGIEMPRSTLEAVMSHEVWEEYYDRLTELIGAHKTTLVFVNTRRMAERVARHLSDRLGEHAVTAHHGSLSKEKRLDAESRLKNGQLKALVATASLELGIDIGHVDLVCQIGSPHRISTLLQRIGRSGHSISGLPKGRVFPMSRDDLVECAAILWAVRRGELDRIVSHECPLDVLAQQMVAEAACCDYGEDDLFALVRRAWPYRDLPRSDFDAVLAMTAEGFATRRGRRSALVHRDEVNARVRGRRGARLLAITSGGAIPEVADYRVVLNPDDIFIGTLNEDFAIESSAGDIFQLGNSSWQVLQIGPGIVRVADAKGAPPTIPFWLGEAPARSDELSRAVSDLRAEIDRRLEAGLPPPRSALRRASPKRSEGGKACATGVMPSTGDDGRASEGTTSTANDAGTTVGATAILNDVTTVAQAFRPAAVWLVEQSGIPETAAEQIVSYLAETRRVLGVIPTQDSLVLERFFDESGGMQLVLHAPFGSRVNKAWGLALRKRFCRQFNFELQAAASEDALLLSLGPQHSFPLADVFRYLHPATARDVLVQAFLDAPVFQTRWRWNTTISLAVPRNRGGRKVPAPLQRMLADDLMAAVFPDAAACLENIPGDRAIPDHPLVKQTVRDCLEEAMDYNALATVLARIHRGELTLISRDTPEPSPLAHEILNAKPYAFLDDAPLEERRAHAVYTRRATEPSAAGDLGALDPAAVDRVRDEARPDPRDADELHDALLTAGYLTEDDAHSIAPDLFQQLVGARRATRVGISNHDSRTTTVWIAAERLPELGAIHANVEIEWPVHPPSSRTARVWTREEALVELVRGRIAVAGPTTAEAIAGSLAVAEPDVTRALLALEGEGVVLRGAFDTRHAEAVKAAKDHLLAGNALAQPSLEGTRASCGLASTKAIAARGESPPAFGQRCIPADCVAPPSNIPDILGRRALSAGRLAALGATSDFHPGPLEHNALGDSASHAAGALVSLQWCDRRLLARIHRYTLNRLRAEIEPVTPADYMRFLFAWQHVETSARLSGVDGLRAVIAVLDGFELAAAAWERFVLTARMERYDPSLLDMLCLTGEVGWARLSPSTTGSEVVGATPIALFLREHETAWVAGDWTVRQPAVPAAGNGAVLNSRAIAVLESLQSRGALFLHELAAATDLAQSELRRAIADLVSAGLITSDGFAGLRAIIAPRANRHHGAGRWSAVARSTGEAARPFDYAQGTPSASRGVKGGAPAREAARTRGAAVSGSEPMKRHAMHRRDVGGNGADGDAAIEAQARALLRRYGVVFRRVLAREVNAAPWRELTRVYRRLEARGDIRGGRFVSGMSGEQFALADAVDRLREVRRTPPNGRLVTISTADPLNLAGIVTAGDRLRSTPSNRVVYRDGVPLAVLEGAFLRPLSDIAASMAGEVATALTGRPMPPVLSGYVG